MQKRYTREQVSSATLSYFGGDELAANVFVSKYVLQDENGYLELTPDDMHRRLAREFARIEAKYPNPMSEEEIYSLLSKPLPEPGDGSAYQYGMGSIVPQGSPMSAVGNPYKVQSLSNCFVIDSPHDSYAGILYTDEQQAQIMKRRGGVGFDISSIRPRGLPTANAAGTTDGIGVFMERYSRTCREVAQGGRRGALMLTVSVKHPEIETFIHIKRDRTKVTGANISIRITDEFMRAVESDSEFTLQWPVDVPLSQARVKKMVKARDIWEQLIDAAWDSAEPGVLFWDTIEKLTPADAYASKGYRSISTNPCGEICLSIGDSCRLLVLDLTKFVVNPYSKNHASKPYFDFVKFGVFVEKAQRLMDDLVDLELEAVDRIIKKIEADPEPDYVKDRELALWKKIRSAGAGGRRTGLGVTALGDALAMLGIQYGSDAAVRKTGNIYRALACAAYRSSITLAAERGAFPAYDLQLEIGNKFLSSMMSELGEEWTEKWHRHGRRNIALTTTAPVGSVSTLTQTTSGIEPVFKTHYFRWKKVDPNDPEARVERVDEMGDKWQKFPVYHHRVKQWMDVTGKSDVSESPYAGATAEEIDWINSVNMQAAAQKWICHSISKTCVTKDALIKTKKGLLYLDEITDLPTQEGIRELPERAVSVYTHRGSFAVATHVLNQGAKDVVRVTLSSGHAFDVTPDHRFYVHDEAKDEYVWVPVLDIRPSHVILTWHETEDSQVQNV